MITVPSGREFLLTPRRNKVFGVPPSIIHCSMMPSGLFTSIWIQAWGLIHSTFVTVPCSLMGLFASNSAAKA